MKFDDLYNKVFVAEQDKIENTEVADPTDFDDVEPLPLPEQPPVEDGDMQDPFQQPVVPSNNISSYITDLEEFANKLNGTEESSLQSIVSRLDRPGTPFDGISGRTRSEIVRVAETLRSISENLKSFIINAAKK
jgi:hypothetical protein